MKEKNSSVPRIPLSGRLSRYTESNPPSTSRNALNTNTTRTTTSCKSSSITDEEEEDEDGKVISLSSIRKSASQTPRITPQLSPKKTPRITPRFHPPKHSTYRGPHLLNSADILSLSENDTTDSMDASQPPPSDPSTIYLPNLIDDSINASSDILFGNEEPSLFDI